MNIFGSKTGKRNVLDAFVSVAMLAAAGSLVWVNILGPRSASRAQDAPVPATPIAIDPFTIKGNPSAPVAIVEFSDFQCPYCGKFARDILPVLQEKYVDRGVLYIAFRNLPLSIHPFAARAAQAATCGGRQNKFWGMHDLIFGNQATIDDVNLRRHAESLSLDLPAFDKCLADESVREEIIADGREARNLKIVSTPTFLVGVSLPSSRMRSVSTVLGAQSIDTFASAIEKAQKAAGNAQK